MYLDSKLWGLFTVDTELRHLLPAQHARCMGEVSVCAWCSEKLQHNYISFLLGLCPKLKNEWNKRKSHFYEMKGDVRRDVIS